MDFLAPPLHTPTSPFVQSLDLWPCERRLLSGSECFLVPCFSRYMSPVAGADTANLRIRPGPADSVLDLARLCFRELGRTPSVGARVSFVGRRVRPIMTAGK